MDIFNESIEYYALHAKFNLACELNCKKKARILNIKTKPMPYD